MKEQDKYSSKEYLEKVDAYWRATNYLTVAQLYLHKNEDVKTEKESYKIGLVLSVGGVNDESFNQSAWEQGALKAQEEYGVEVSYLESQSDADYTPNIEKTTGISEKIISW